MDYAEALSGFDANTHVAITRLGASSNGLKSRKNVYPTRENCYL
jgi:hypothetical protein